MRPSVLREKLAEQVFRWLDIFRSQLYELAHFWYLLICRKALKSFMVVTVLHD